MIYGYETNTQHNGIEIKVPYAESVLYPFWKAIRKYRSSVRNKKSFGSGQWSCNFTSDSRNVHHYPDWTPFHHVSCLPRSHIFLLHFILLFHCRESLPSMFSSYKLMCGQQIIFSCINIDIINNFTL